MSLLGRLMAPLLAKLTVEPRDPEASRVGYSGRTPAGVYVTADSALKNAAVWACVRYLSQSVAVLPWHVHRRTPDGKGSVLMLSHPTDWVLSSRPNPETTPFQFRETLMAWCLLRGNGYAEIERDGAGRVLALWPLHPDRVDVKRDTANRLYYEVDNETQAPVVLWPEDMFHVRGLGDGPVGLPVIHYAAQSIGWAQATEIFGASFFGEGANFKGVVKNKKALDSNAMARQRAEFDQLYKGPRGRRTAHLDMDADFIKVTATPNESQFVETMKYQVEGICRWFGVPPHKVMHLEKSTFNNIEHQAIEVVVDSLTPWVKRFEQEADAKLFGQNRSWLYTRMNMNALLRGDFKTRAEGFNIFRNMGILSVNEIRALEDMNPISAAEGGNLRVMQGQYVPLERIGSEPVAPPPAAPPPVELDEDDDLAPEETEAMAWVEKIANQGGLNAA